jgi:uncharacterized protein (TIGR03435 family)
MRAATGVVYSGREELVSRIVAVWTAAVLLGWTVAAAQSKPTFEVASIKPQTEPLSSATARTAGPQVRPGGVFNSSHVTVELLLTFAYDLRSYQIIGGPDWVRQDMFQVAARAGNDAPPDQIKLMIGSLLEDRFKMVAHRERREMSVEALVLARRDGRLGPDLLRVDDCRAAMREINKRPPVLSAQANTLSGCSAGVLGLARTLSLDLYLNKPVIDATALDGSFRYIVTSRPLMSEPATAAATDPRYPSLPVALEEQLGIKLESRRMLFETLVIDSIERPSEN